MTYAIFAEKVMTGAELLNGPLAGHVHGVITIACLAAVGFSIWKFGTRPTGRRVVWGILSGFVGFFLLSMFTAHACDAGEPNFYMSYAGLSVAAPIIACKSRVLRSVLAGTFLLVFTSLAFHYVDLVHEPGYTGNPASLRIGRWASLKYARALAAQNAGHVPPGFLDEALGSGAWKGTQDAADPLYALAKGGVTSRKERARWYTHFTGLWETEDVRLGLWTPGGALSEIADKMELRERQAQ
jgi:hypothetical protein